LLDILKVSPNY